MFNRILMLSLLLSLFTCSSRYTQLQNDRKSKNNFLAYYNTFFTAEKSFNEAEKLIQLQTDTANLSIQINNLLDLAIENCLIIESDFYETKYLDDSYFILAMSSFYKNKITASNYYFEQLTLRFPNSIYVNKINIYKGFINLKIGKLNKYHNCLAKIDINELNNDEKYNYYLLQAYYYDIINNSDLVLESYLEAINYSETKIKKYFIYNKLYEISEKRNNHQLCIEYIEEIQKNDIITQFNKELFLKWLLYKNKLGQFDDVLIRLEELLENSKILKDKIFYEVEIARTKMFANEYQDATLILDQLLEKHFTSTVIKNEMSEMYYLLGQIYFMENDYDLAQQNYQLSIDKSRTSKYGKKSQEQISALIKYSNYEEEINYISMLPEVDDEFGQVGNNLDSLIFHLAQIQYFDLNLKTESFNNFMKVIKDFPESNFREKSLIVMNINKPDTIWEKILTDEYTYNSANKIDDVEVLIDSAWSFLQDSNTEECLEKFKEIYDAHNSDTALYIIGFIYDQYNNDVVSAMKYYKIYLEEFIEGEFYKTVNDRVLDIKNMFEEEILENEQKVSFSKGFIWLIEKDNVDSSKFYFNLSSNGNDRTINLYGKSLKQKVDKYNENMILYLDGNEGNNIDSIAFNLANLLFFDFGANQKSESYYLKVINSNNDYKNLSYATLSMIDSTSSWDHRLFEIVQDSIEYNKLFDGLEKSQHLNYISTINSDKISDELLWLQEKYNLLFKASSEHPDTIKNETFNLDKSLDSSKIELEDRLIDKNNLMKSFRTNTNNKNDSIINKITNTYIDSSKIKLNSIVE